MTTKTEAEVAEWNRCVIGKPEYRDGSAKKGWYQYDVTMATARNNFGKSRTVVGDKKTTRHAAEQSAIAKADQEFPVFCAEVASNK